MKVCFIALVPFILEVFIINKFEDRTMNIFGRTGLIYNLTYIFIICGVLKFLSKLVDFTSFFKTNKKNSVFNKIDKGLPILYTQKELNDIFREADFEYEERYSDVLAFLFSSLFYISIHPILAAFAIFYLFLHYWNDKVKYI
jgi:hypothetical protein